MSAESRLASTVGHDGDRLGSTVGGVVVDLGVDDENLWWFNLRTQQVEQGLGDPNSERMGPYLTRQEAETALERAAVRNEAWDEQED